MSNLTADSSNLYSNFTFDKGYQLDEFLEMKDLDAQGRTEMRELNSLADKDNKTSDEIIRMNYLIDKYKDSSITAGYINKLAATVLGIEKYTKDNIVDYVNNKQVEMQNYVNNQATTFNNKLNKFNHKGEFNPIIQYYQWNTVSLEGESFLALQDSLGQTPNHNADTIYWAKIASKGSQGIQGQKGDDGVGLVFNQSGYNNIDIFHVNECVQDDGNLWACTQDCQGQKPSLTSSYWKLVVAKGASTVTKLLTNYVKLITASVNVPIGISTFNSTIDTLIVHKDGILQTKNVHYKINVNGTSIDNYDGSVFPENTEFDFYIQKNINQDMTFADGTLLQLKSVYEDKLSQDLQDKIDSIGNKANSSDLTVLQEILNTRTPATATPLMDASTGVVGNSTLYAREDHVHPSDASKAPINNPAFTGTVTLPTNSVSDSLLISLNAVTAVGTTQGTATTLTKDMNVITTSTVGGGVVIQGATTGKIVVIINKTSNPINVYPALGHYFDGLAANTPISLPANAFIELYGFNSTKWNSTINSVTNAINTIISDTGGYFSTKNTEAALQQIGSSLTDIANNKLPLKANQSDLSAANAVLTDMANKQIMLKRKMRMGGMF